MKRTLLAVVVVAVLAAPAIAAPAETSIDGPSTVEPGEQVTYTFTLTNTGENESAYLLNTTLPDGWEIVDQSNDSGNWQSSDTEWLYVELAPGETREPSLTISVPENADDGAIEVTSRASTSDGLQSTAAKEVTVEESGGGGGGGGGDDGGDSGAGGGGGGDDGGDSGGDSGAGGGGGGDSGGGGGGDDGGDSGAGGGGDDSGDSGDADTIYGEDNTTDGESNTTDEQSNTTDGESDETTTSNPTETVGGPASEPADESPTDEASDTETDDGTAASDTESDSNTAVGVGLGALLLLAVGVGVVTVRRNVTEEPIVEGSIAEIVSGGLQTNPETTSPDTGDGYGEADIEVLSFHAAPDKCSLTYSTEKMGNKEIGDEIREIARGYASADNEDIRAQRLEATIVDGDRTVATWEIKSEWMEQFNDGDLSAEAFERRAVVTLSFGN